MSYPDYFPDGLSEDVIDRLLAEVDTQVEPVRRPTCGFAWCEVDQRRERRERRRAAAQLVRVLPFQTPPVVESEAA